MGFLEVGTPVGWEESESVRSYVKKHGLLQFLSLWEVNKDRVDSQLRWGEEVEYSLVDIDDLIESQNENIADEASYPSSPSSYSSSYSNDDNNQSARIYVDASDLIEQLTVREHIRPRPPTQLSSDWHPEFANHMIEAIPSPPYPLNLNSILMLEPSMRLRRAKIQSILPPSKFVTSQTAFPRFGLGEFIFPQNGEGVNPLDSITRSVFIPDELINPHPRFGTLVNNIRIRRGAKPFITIPLFEDENTYKNLNNSYEGDWSLSQTKLNRYEVEKLSLKTINPIKGQIYMDCFAFGMGMSCVQTTFATPTVSIARHLYDQLAILGPLFLALTASTPILRGLLADTDTRWSTLEQAVDCRTEEEMSVIPKSRYSGFSLYISDQKLLKDNLEYLNDTNAPINEEAKKLLMETGGIDEILATHFGHLWIRDPMVIFAEKIDLDDSRAVDHFENIQSTNWNSIRFKPPPPSSIVDDEINKTTSSSTIKATNNIQTTKLSPIGWRVEFRTPEIQLTDLDNAAGVALISVLAQMILTNNLNLYIPMSMNDLNMKRSWERDAVNKQKFFFRNDITKNGNVKEITEMTLNEILTGCPRVGFKGLIPMSEDFLSNEVSLGRCGLESRKRFSEYATLLQKRASGELMTCAQYLRHFVLKHPAYQKDSIVSPIINYDLTVLSTNLGFGIWAIPELHGNLNLPQTPLPSKTKLPHLSFIASRDDSFICISDIIPSTADTGNNSNLPNLQSFVNDSKAQIMTTTSPTTSPTTTATSTTTTPITTTLTNSLSSSPSSPLHVYKKKVIMLNEIQSIYTMPVGVTTRFGGLCRNCNNSKEPSVENGESLKMKCGGDLFDLTYGEIVKSTSTNKLMEKKNRIDDNGAVSSEDFTRSWILKGFDCVGKGISKKSSKKCHFDIKNTSTNSLQPTSDNCNSTFNRCESSSALKQMLINCHSKFQRDDSVFSETQTSTNCPSSSDLIGDDLIHELSRSLSLGFDTEEDLEYFKQVCDASA